ncbi:MAG TPA: helix-turn-helix domain-containing protein [Pyrinomonadaceae bacterium]|jgi:hypothetical protein
MAIALHTDEQGWAWPRVSTIRKETGYEEDTVHKALNKLCEVKIKGRRVLLRAKEPPAHYTPEPRDKNYARNFYLIFPSDAEVAKYEGNEDDEPSDSNLLRKTVSEKTESVFSDTENSDTVFRSQSLITKEEPVLKEEPIRDEAETHTHEVEPAPSLFELTETQDRVCVSEDLRFEDYLDYARHTPGFTNPGGWAMKHYPLRDADVLVREWLESKTPEAISEARATPVNENLYFDEAAHRVRTLMQYGQKPEDIIASMQLDDDVRQRLIEKFVNVEVSDAESSRSSVV